MKHTTIIKMQTLVLVATLAAYAPATLAQSGKPAGGAKSQTAAAAADAAPKSPCGNQTLCYDTADFTATVAQFRTSTDGSGNKMLDAIVHFQNKTDQVLSLAYADGSAESMDDHGNRYELNKNGVRGMGTVTGTTPDAKFVLQPNGTGDARFELLWNPKDQIAGATYELDLSIREMSRGDDKQWALGNESLLHYDGLANGSASASASPAGAAGTSGGTTAASGDAAKASSGSAAGSGLASGSPSAASAGSSVASNLASGGGSAGQPCASGTADAAVANTTAAITSISSLFGHKASSASAAPCATSSKAATGATSGPTAKTGSQPAAAAAPPSRAVTKPAPAPQTGVVNATLRQPVAATPPKTPAQPATAAKKPPVVPAAKKPTPVATPVPATSSGQ